MALEHFDPGREEEWPPAPLDRGFAAFRQVPILMFRIRHMQLNEERPTTDGIILPTQERFTSNHCISQLAASCNKNEQPSELAVDGRLASEFTGVSRVM